MADFKDILESGVDFVDSTIDRLGAQNRAFATAEEARAEAMKASVDIQRERERRTQDRKDRNQELMTTALYILLGVAAFGTVTYLFIYIRKNLNK
jgi:methanogenic corrinoid protein MtbC1